MFRTRLLGNILVNSNKQTYEKKLFILKKNLYFNFRIMDCMGGVMSHLPFLRFVCPELCGYNEIMRITNNLLQFLNEEISQHENQIHERFPQDLIDAFLLEMRTKRPDENSIFDRTFAKLIFENLKLPSKSKFEIVNLFYLSHFRRRTVDAMHGSVHGRIRNHQQHFIKHVLIFGIESRLVEKTARRSGRRRWQESSSST